MGKAFFSKKIEKIMGKMNIFNVVKTTSRTILMKLHPSMVIEKQGSSVVFFVSCCRFVSRFHFVNSCHFVSIQKSVMTSLEKRKKENFRSSRNTEIKTVSVLLEQIP